MLPESEWLRVIDTALRRVYSWRVPPNWSASEWMKEMRAHGASAAWQAVCDYDPSRGIPFSAYAHQRVWASALTRYRQEWIYALRAPCNADDGGRPEVPSLIAASSLQESLLEALTELSPSECWLIEQLFWEGRTEIDIARQLGITQQAVSKRKSVILRELRQRTESHRTAPGWPGTAHSDRRL